MKISSVKNENVIDEILNAKEESMNALGLSGESSTTFGIVSNDQISETLVGKKTNEVKAEEATANNDNEFSTKKEIQKSINTIDKDTLNSKLEKKQKQKTKPPKGLGL